MKLVRLLPARKRLKELIKAHGAEGWKVVDDRPVECFKGSRGIFIISPDGEHSRWVLPIEVA